jgi:hypothetical protein
MEAQVAKIVESQTLILAKFAGKPKPNPVEDVKMMRSSKENAEELDKSHVPEYTYTVADFVKMIEMKHPLPEVSNDETYNVFVDHVVAKVCELDDERKKLFSKLPAPIAAPSSLNPDSRTRSRHSFHIRRCVTPGRSNASKSKIITRSPLRRNLKRWCPNRW